MPFDNTTITEAAHEQFFKDMRRGSYTSADFQRYNAEAGWQEWMNEYTDALPTETCSEQETNNITAVQRKMWDQFWQEAAKAIEEAERNYHGDFVSRCKISKKRDAFDIYTFEFDGDTYEYDLGSSNGEHYAGWNTRTKEDCKIFDLAVEIEEDEYADLGIILSKI